MRLMQQIRGFAVPRGAVALWWLGQNGYILKSPGGTLTGVDLYLSNSCEGLVPPFDLTRKVPVLIEPEDLELDYFLCTHNHQDHTDPETLSRLRHPGTTVFAGPMPSCQVFRDHGIAEACIRPLWPAIETSFGDLSLTGTFALPTDSSDLNHMGFVLRYGDGPKVYITGDTDDHELLRSVARHAPDVMITCINGGFNNLSHWAAARLAADVKPRVAIPCHYDLFPDNACDPLMFRASLRACAPAVAYQELRHGEPWVFPAG